MDEESEGLIFSVEGAGVSVVEVGRSGDPDYTVQYALRGARYYAEYEQVSVFLTFSNDILYTQLVELYLWLQ